jgi:hypothetical protein
MQRTAGGHALCALFGTIAPFVAMACNKPPGPASAVLEATAPSAAIASASNMPAPSDAAPAGSAAPSASVPAVGSPFTRFDFEHDAVDAGPAGFTSVRTGGGRVGQWIVRAEPDAPSPPNAVVQVDADPTDMRFPVLLADAPPLADVSVSTRCKPIAGKVDRACGVVCRATGPDDYYLARANALENNVRFYVVEHGKRRQLASWSGAVASGQWHSLMLVCHGKSFSVTFDGARVITHADETLKEAGKAGLWTKADSVTAFDDVTFHPVANL